MPITYFLLSCLLPLKNMEVEKGKTAKYLREKLGGIPEQAKENLKANLS